MHFVFKAQNVSVVLPAPVKSNTERNPVGRAGRTPSRGNKIH